jgi:hypothetical protein
LPLSNIAPQHFPLHFPGCCIYRRKIIREMPA